MIEKLDYIKDLGFNAIMLSGELLWSVEVFFIIRQ